MAKAKNIAFENVDFHDLCNYAGTDGIVTLEIMKRIWPDVTRKPIYRYFFQNGEVKDIVLPSIVEEMDTVKMPAHEFLTDMEVEGMPYDKERAEIMGTAMRREIESLERRIHDFIDPGYNLDSDKDLTALLYTPQGFNLKSPFKTKKGGEATSYEALEVLIGNYPEHEAWLKPLARRRKVAGIYRGFIETYREKYVRRDGKVHASYNLFGTSSHRISSNDPNMLNLPAWRSSKPYDLRSLYTVPRKMSPDGLNVINEIFAFITMDFSSCEVKILAALCEDEGLIQACREGKDFHTYTFSTISGIPYDDIRKVLKASEAALKADPTLAKLHEEYSDQRQAYKATTFGLIYGSSNEAIATGIGRPIDEVNKIIEAYFTTFPKIKTFIENAHRMAIHNHYLVTPFGQRKQAAGTLPCFRKTAVYNASLRNAQNFLVQSTASTLGLLVFTEINKKLREMGGAVICTVYDSWEGYVPISRLAEAVEMGFYYMNDWPQQQWSWLTFPIGADAEVGINWGKSLQEVKRGVTQEQCLKAVEESRHLQEKYDQQMWDAAYAA